MNVRDIIADNRKQSHIAILESLPMEDVDLAKSLLWELMEYQGFFLDEEVVSDILTERQDLTEKMTMLREIAEDIYHLQRMIGDEDM
jgi:hypothetical protein